MLQDDVVLNSNRPRQVLAVARRTAGTIRTDSGTTHRHLDRFHRDEADLLALLPDSTKPVVRNPAEDAKGCSPMPSNSGASPMVYPTQQPTLNVVLKEDVLTKALHVANWCAQQCEEARKSGSVLDTTLKGLDDALYTYQDRVKWTGEIPVEEEGVIEKAELSLPYRAVRKIVADWPSPPPSVPLIDEQLQELLSSNLPRRRRSSLGKHLGVLNTIGHPHDIYALVFEVHEALSRGSAVEGLLRELDEIEPDVARVKALIAEGDRGRQEAAQAGKFPEAEALQLDMIHHLQELLMHLRKRIKVITGSSNEKVRSESMDLLGRCWEAEQKLRTEHTDLLRHGKADLLSMQKAISDLDHERAKASEQYKTNCKNRWRDLQLNAQEQDDVFRGIEGLLEKLCTLQDHRQNMVERHMESAEEEQRLVAVYNHTRGIMSKHESDLEELVRNVGDVLSVCRAVGKYFQDAHKKLEEVLGKESTALEALQKTELREYHQAYRTFHLTTGDMLFRKEKRLEGVKRQCRSLKLHIDTAEETLDPMLEVYCRQMDDLMSLETDITTLMADLREQSAEEAALFAPIMEAMTEAGMEFTVPQEELDSMLLARDEALLQTFKMYVDENIADTDTQSINIRKKTALTKLNKSSKPTSPASTGKISQQTLDRIAGTPTKAVTAIRPRSSPTEGKLMLEKLPSADPIPQEGHTSTRPYTAEARRPLPSMPPRSILPKPLEPALLAQGA